MEMCARLLQRPRRQPCTRETPADSLLTPQIAATPAIHLPRHLPAGALPVEHGDNHFLAVLAVRWPLLAVARFLLRDFPWPAHHHVPHRLAIHVQPANALGAGDRPFDFRARANMRLELPANPAP